MVDPEREVTFLRLRHANSSLQPSATPSLPVVACLELVEHLGTWDHIPMSADYPGLIVRRESSGFEYCG